MLVWDKEQGQGFDIVYASMRGVRRGIILSQEKGDETRMRHVRWRVMYGFEPEAVTECSIRASVMDKHSNTHCQCLIHCYFLLDS